MSNRVLCFLNHLNDLGLFETIVQLYISWYLGRNKNQQILLYRKVKIYKETCIIIVTGTELQQYRFSFVCMTDTSWRFSAL